MMGMSVAWSLFAYMSVWPHKFVWPCPFGGANACKCVVQWRRLWECGGVWVRVGSRLCVCTSACACAFVRVFRCAVVCVRRCSVLCVNSWLCLRMWVWADMWVRAWVRVRMRFVCACEHAHVNGAGVSVCVDHCVHLKMCDCVWAWICMCVSECLCAFVCVRL